MILVALKAHRKCNLDHSCHITVCYNKQIFQNVGSLVPRNFDRDSNSNSLIHFLRKRNFDDAWKRDKVPFKRSCRHGNL